MKQLIIAVIVILMASVSAISGEWCQWDGSQGVNCQPDTPGFIVIGGVKTRTPAIANAKGWYKLLVVKPTVAADQIVDGETWAFSGDTIIKTPIVRDMTAEEIANRSALPMSLADYVQFRLFIESGAYTQQELVALLRQHLPAEAAQELIDAYLARKQLLGD